MEGKIRQLHSRLLVIMSELHKICENNDLRYSLAGGSLIGALRHEGFIPWDDDMDIMMPYEDYKKFKSIVASSKHEWLEYKIPGESPNYYRTMLRAIDSRTTLVEGDHDDPCGIFIDIFPFLPVGDSLAKAKFEFYLYRFFKAPLMRKVHRFKDKNRIKEFLLSLFGKALPTSFCWYCMRKQMERLSKKDSSDYYADLDGTEKGIVKKDCFNGYKITKFEDKTFWVLENSHMYLSSVFGDYMKLPPEKDQKPHHLAYVNIHQSYHSLKKE